jgi:hypothetical protein
LLSYGSGASWVSSIGNGCCRLGAELKASVSGDVRSWRVPQSPELGDLLEALSSGNVLPFLSYIVIPQWLVHFTRYLQPMKQDS